MDTEAENPMEALETGTVKAEKRPKRGWIIAGLALLVLLVGAAFLGGRLMNSRTQGNKPGDSGFSITGPGGKSVEIKMKNAKELPTRQPEVAGIFDRREDNSIFLGTGNLTMAVTGKNGEEPEAASSYDGPVVEVVVSRETKVYRDVTMEGGQLPEQGGEIQQKVEPGSIDEIGENSMVSVWGRKSGDRVIAEVLVYSSPVFMAAPGR